MKMELKVILDNLVAVGCGKQAVEIAEKLYKTEQTDELIRLFRKFRCSLMDEMHESQRKVDRMDYLIRKAEKEMIKSTNHRRVQK
jgi:hypothetical protein